MSQVELKNAPGYFLNGINGYYLIVKKHADGYEQVLRGWKGRSFKTSTAALRSAENYAKKFLQD